MFHFYFLWCKWDAIMDQCLSSLSPSPPSDSPSSPTDDVTVISVLSKNIEKRFTYYLHIAKKFYLKVCPRSEQALIVDKILDVYAERTQCSVFVEGPPGTGKSSIATLLCGRLNGVLCHFSPTRSGESFDEIKVAADQSCEGKPIVILMDEGDVMLRNTVMIIFYGTAPYIILLHGLEFKPHSIAFAL